MVGRGPKLFCRRPKDHARGVIGMPNTALLKQGEKDDKARTGDKLKSESYYVEYICTYYTTR